MSNLVASQIMTHTDVASRASSIEKWLAVADICRCLNNYNGVLEIIAALEGSAIYRLKKTWAKVCKQVDSPSFRELLKIIPHLYTEKITLLSLFSDKGTEGQTSEDCVIRGTVQEPQRDTEKVNIASEQRKIMYMSQISS